MIIVTTPMCKKILEFAGIKDFKVNKHPDEEEADLAILLSENKTKISSVNIKLNTFSQIKRSIIEVSKYNENKKENEDFDKIVDKIFEKYEIANKWLNKDEKNNLKEINSKIKVKVYSKFIKDIIEDMGFDIVDEKYSYVVFPDYMDVKENNGNDYKFIEVPTHSNVPLNPIKRAKLRYSLLEHITIDYKNFK